MAQESSITDLLTAAVQQHEAGELVTAENLYHQVLKRDPAHPDALHLLGLIAHATGNFMSAIESIRKALVLRPEEAVFHYNLANVLRDAGQIDAGLRVAA
jgi:predicted Zn-dependent protease